MSAASQATASSSEYIAWRLLHCSADLQVHSFSYFTSTYYFPVYLYLVLPFPDLYLYLYHTSTRSILYYLQLHRYLYFTLLLPYLPSLHR